MSWRHEWAETWSAHLTNIDGSKKKKTHMFCHKKCRFCWGVEQKKDWMEKTEVKIKGEKIWDQGGEAFSTWDCPGWTQAAPSLYKQPLASSSPPLLSVHLPFFPSTLVVRHSFENMNKNELFFFFPPPFMTSDPPYAISKVNTHTTELGWLTSTVGGSVSNFLTTSTSLPP